MSEETAVAEAVPSTDVPVAVDPALLNKPVRPEEQPGNSDAELLKHKLGLANQHAKQAKKEADDARQQMQQLKDELEHLKITTLPRTVGAMFVPETSWGSHGLCGVLAIPT